MALANSYGNSYWSNDRMDYEQDMQRQRQRQYEDMMRAQDYERQRMHAAQQQMAYIPPQQLAAVQKAKADDRFTSNKKLLLLEN